jgi:tripeptide aminopeptidase
MKEMIEPHIHLIENAKKAMEELEVTPIIVPIRGGTDGARLSYMNLPCPNLCTGGHNFHGRYEYISIQSMEKVTEIILKIIELYSEK